jgi:hypothetical protein
VNVIKLISDSFKKYPILWYVLLLIAVMMGYSQIAFMKYAVKYDMIDCYYPWRYMVSESLRNGMLPFWNPYQTLGYPLHADPQSGAWYPLTWFIGYFREYDIYSLHFEYLIHLCIAAFGMFFLGNVLKFDNRVSFIIAIAYVFSGFFIGNSQHFTYTISGAWIPLILAQYLLLFEKNHFKHALYFSFFMFMLVSGGYPAFLFILFYFLIILFFYYCIKLLREKKYLVLKTFILNNLIAALSTVLLSAVVLVSVFYLTPYITRGGKIPLEMAFLCPLSPKSFISFLLPFAAIRNMAFYDTDLSMSNAYFGLIPLTFFIYALFVKKPGIYILFIAYALVCLAAAMGRYTPVREFLYDYVPFMGMFRFPSLFRLFPILFFLLIAGYGLTHFIEKGLLKDKKLLIIFASIFGVLLAMLVLSRFEGYLMMKGFIKDELFKASSVSLIRQHVAFQSVVQLFFTGLLIASLFVFKNVKKILFAFIIISSADMLFATQLNAPYTVYSEFYKVADIKKHSNTFPKGFPVPAPKNVLLNNDTAGLGNGTFWKNLNIFHKQIAWDGFAPILFKGYAYLSDSVPDVFRTILSNPPVYLSSAFYPEDSAKEHQQNNSGKNKNIYLKTESLNKLDSAKCSSTTGDTAFITSFSPEKIMITTETRSPQLLCLLQNYYPGWTVRINEKKAEITTVNFGLMSVLIPSGKSTIQFIYDFKPVRTSFYISLLSLIVFLLFVCGRLILRKSL